jgi:hypothetical protein
MRDLEWMVTDCRADVRVVLANENSEVMYVVKGRLSRWWSRLEAFQLRLTLSNGRCGFLRSLA